MEEVDERSVREPNIFGDKFSENEDDEDSENDDNSDALIDPFYQEDVSDAPDDIIVEEMVPESSNAGKKLTKKEQRETELKAIEDWEMHKIEDRPMQRTSRGREQVGIYSLSS